MSFVHYYRTFKMFGLDDLKSYVLKITITCFHLFVSNKVFNRIFLGRYFKYGKNNKFNYVR
jgi:hypothetical protein